MARSGPAGAAGPGLPGRTGYRDTGMTSQVQDGWPEPGPGPGRLIRIRCFQASGLGWHGEGRQVLPAPGRGGPCGPAQAQGPGLPA